MVDTQLRPGPTTTRSNDVIIFITLFLLSCFTMLLLACTQESPGEIQDCVTITPT